VKRDLSALPADVRDAAHVDYNGEVSWRDDQAADAIQALLAAGHRVLGLDIRDYFGDGTFFEAPWYAADSRSHENALQKLSRIDELEVPDNAVERRVLVTWE